MQRHENWLLISEEELKLAKKAILADDVIVIPTVFLTQQAAEKALKAYLAFHGRAIEKTHNLLDLLRSCVKLNRSFDCLLEEALNLNPYVTKCRYPEDAFIIPTLMAVEKCIQDAEKIIKFVKVTIQKNNSSHII